MPNETNPRQDIRLIYNNSSIMFFSKKYISKHMLVATKCVSNSMLEFNISSHNQTDTFQPTSLSTTEIYFDAMNLLWYISISILSNEFAVSWYQFQCFFEMIIAHNFFWRCFFHEKRHLFPQRSQRKYHVLAQIKKFGQHTSTYLRLRTKLSHSLKIQQLISI